MLSHRPSPSQATGAHNVEQATLPKPGDVVAGKYRIEKIVGAGGMGIVYAAHHLVLDQRVALKLLLVDSLRGDETVERFMREARAAARMRSEHVVRVTDAGALENGLPFLVMEYLDGCDLAELLRLEGPLGTEDVADSVLQVLAALAEAHSAGIVHRDLKPANLFLALREDGTPIIKILDFGISKQTTERAQWKELTGKAVLGTPNYMSPEQLRSSKNIDARADIWSIGVVIYELLSGRLPFDGEGPGEIFAAILEQAPTPLCAHCPDLPKAWEALVSRCLKRSPEARFADVGDLARAIAPLASGRWGHLVAGIDLALARSVRLLTQANTALLSAAVAAAITSMPPPTSRAAQSLSQLVSRQTFKRASSSPTFATDKTLLAEILPVRAESAIRWSRWTGAAGITAGAVAIAVITVHGVPPVSTSAAAQAPIVAMARSNRAPVDPASALPPLTGPAAPSTSPTTPEESASPLNDAPEAASAAAALSPAAAPATTRRTPAATAKKTGGDLRPTFLKSWR